MTNAATGRFMLKPRSSAQQPQNLSTHSLKLVKVPVQSKFPSSHGNTSICMVAQGLGNLKALLSEEGSDRQHL